MEWKNIYRGLIMVASDVVPGVSGGTIAVLLGIYDNLIAALNGLFSKDWEKHLSFLITLGLGIAFSIFSLAIYMICLLLIFHILNYYIFISFYVFFCLFVF